MDSKFKLSFLILSIERPRFIYSLTELLQNDKMKKNYHNVSHKTKEPSMLLLFALVKTYLN